MVAPIPLVSNCVSLQSASSYVLVALPSILLNVGTCANQVFKERNVANFIFIIR